MAPVLSPLADTGGGGGETTGEGGGTEKTGAGGNAIGGLCAGGDAIGGGGGAGLQSGRVVTGDICPFWLMAAHVGPGGSVPHTVALPCWGMRMTTPLAGTT